MLHFLQGFSYGLILPGIFYALQFLKLAFGAGFSAEGSEE